MTRIMCHSPEGLSSCSRSGFLQQLINEVYRDDLLTQLNSLELLKDLALTPHGLAYLDEQGVVGKLQELLVTAQSDPLAGFLMPGKLYCNNYNSGSPLHRENRGNCPPKNQSQGKHRNFFNFAKTQGIPKFPSSEDTEYCNI